MTITVHWPQTILLSMLLAQIVGYCLLHGKQSRINAWHRLLHLIVVLFLLWKGGFFN